MNWARPFILVACALISCTVNAGAHSYALLSSFGSSEYDGIIPYATVVLGRDGNWYGTTGNGGTVARQGYCALGCGTVFRMTPSGERETIHDFSGPDGEVPVGPLLLANDGLLYGTATAGGGHNGGTVFRIDPARSTFTILHRFDPRTPLAGADPQGPLMQGRDGFLYGVTVGGHGPGGPVNEENEWAIAYRMRPSGHHFTVLHAFHLNRRFGAPTDGLIQASDGRLYGTCGVSLDGILEIVFGMNADGSDFHVLHAFHGSTPFYESPGLIEGSPGMLYGVTTGKDGAAGTIFQIGIAGDHFRTLHRFHGHEGAAPFARLTVGPHHLLYGTTSVGGVFGFGTLFSIRMNGSYFNVRHAFGGFPHDGDRPLANLTALGGTLYGTTQQGGHNRCSPFFGCGTVFAWTL
jgi:uncharacterized repeat protein (TIGR03803 family)